MQLLDISAETCTSVNGRDVDHLVVEANEAFTRIEKHRKLFRQDWLPFLDGVYHLSRIAWERTGRHQTLDGKPDWTYDPVQVAFRKLTKDLSWARYFDSRRTLLSVLRNIGGDRERFLAWYDGLKESVRELIGSPGVLWEMFKKQMPAAADVEDDDHDQNHNHNNNRSAANTNTANDSINDSTNDSTTEQHTERVKARSAASKAANQAKIRYDEDCITERNNGRWHDFGVDLRASLDSGESTLKTGLREELDRLLEDAA